MDRVTFNVNGKKYSVGSEVSSDVALVDYLREFLELRGTKYMCREGGCGACVVAVTAKDPHTGQPRTFSVNSCLISITQCQDWSITTVEGLGDRLKGYHPIQRTLAEYNGTQCGYCSVGWVMAMYSLLESRSYHLTMLEIEDSFGSNTCRCTGYRPILDAFKSFATDAPKPNKNIIPDIEDLHICKSKGKDCQKTCKQEEWCMVTKEDLKGDDDYRVMRINLSDGRLWFKVANVRDIFDILNVEGYDSYMLVGGNTGRGVAHIFEFPKILIDVASVMELKQYYIDQNLIVGAGMTLTDVMTLFHDIAKENEEFSYLQKLYDHLNLVAHIPVRNVGSIAGNLMMKHRVPEFASDVFLLFESIGALLTIVDRYHKLIEISPQDFRQLDMVGRVIINVKIPPLSKNYHFASFKVMPRYQNAHAQVNAAYLYEFDHRDKETILSARIVIGGLSAAFVHANKTEKYLIGKKIFTNEVLQGALKVLKEELVVEEIPAELKPEYREKTALGLFFKGLLVLIPESQLKPRYRSGARDIRKTRPLSKGTEVQDSNPIIWPLTEPMPKIEALIQCAGEIKYTNDLPRQPHETFAAFVTSDIGVGVIEKIDPTPALKLPGVIAFYTAKDIPGRNVHIPILPGILTEEPFLADGAVKYYDHPFGIIVAETEAIANRAALLVQVTYKKNKDPPILTVNDAKSRDPSRISVFFIYPPRGRGANVQRVINNSVSIFSQYFYTMERYACVGRPNDDGIDLVASTHWPDLSHYVSSLVLKLPENRINMTIPPIGGSYGSRISRTTQVIAACALATYLTNRPCRFETTIQSSMRSIGKRFPCTCDFEVGVNSDGEIQYMEYHFYEDNGYTFSEVIIALALPQIKNCYDNTRWSYKMFNVLTDNASNSWCRSPGNLEAHAMTETIMEQISYELNRDPLQVRLSNINPNNTAIRDIVAEVVKDSEYEKRKIEVKEYNKNNRWKKRGIRVALMSYGALINCDFQVQLTVFHGDGTIVVRHGAVEVGQGINTRVVQVIAYTLNLSLDMIKVKPNDMVSNPNSYVTGGSRSTDSVCMGAIKCCQILLDRLAETRQRLNNPVWTVLVEAAYRAGINLSASYHTTSNDQSTFRSDGAIIVEVELDILTGEHEIRRVDLVEDVGTSVNPELDIGQIEGAFTMGLGYWTSEHLIYDKKTGELQTDRSWNYKVPLAKDIPLDFRVKLRRNSYNTLGALGSRIVAEPPICLGIGVAFALREAIAYSREESGYPMTQWFNVDGPFTLETNVLKADAKLEEFLFD